MAVPENDEAVTPLELRRAAMDLLARREHSAEELSQKLQKRWRGRPVVSDDLEGVLQSLALEGLQPGVAWPGGVWTANCDGCLSDVGTIDLMQAGVGVLEITYTVEGLCGDAQSVAMEVVGCDVEIVNVFSPNGDEQNDELVFKYLTSFPGNQLTIFDRWGNLVYQKSNYGNNWRAEDVAEGTYYYVLTIPGKDDLTGSFTLVR